MAFRGEAQSVPEAIRYNQPNSRMAYVLMFIKKATRVPDGFLSLCSNTGLFASGLYPLRNAICDYLRHVDRRQDERVEGRPLRLAVHHASCRANRLGSE